jgi:2-polyprenyl-6-hydroxyphenyl methylase/3-demethylubiquinone-9 3-methyltransferase
MSTTSEYSAENRFAFGKNWASFLEQLDDDRIAEAERSLREWLGVSDLQGKTFIDVGSGSGLFSLAARRLGARVSSFDYDPDSVACTAELRRRYFPDDPEWILLGQASALDEAFMASLGQFDVVYSWGVLHHTGDMWRGLDQVDRLVRPGGLLYLMIYEDRGLWSVAWREIKRTYNTGPVGRAVVTGVAIPYYISRGLLEDLIRLRDPRVRYQEYKRQRGMSKWHDWIDWIGGYPYEFARPDQLASFYRGRGYEVERQHAEQSVFRKVGRPYP